jgi:DNA-directed RNA polymerase specialized sigma24 family protein
MRNTQENQLLDDLKSGKPRAIDNLYNFYYEFLLSAAYRILRNEFEAEEAVQCTFIKFWENKLYNNAHSSLKKFLYGIVYNTSVERLKHQARMQKRECGLCIIRVYKLIIGLLKLGI